MATIDGSTIIGESILISGSLNGDEDLTVRGRVEGTLTLTRTLVVEPTGVLGIAALFARRIDVPDGARVGVILSGGNVDVRDVCRWLNN